MIALASPVPVATWLICRDCYADYRFDESPSALRCAGCAAWRAWWESRNPARPEAER